MKYKFATGNKNKLLEFQSILGEEIESIDIDLTEIQSLDPLAVIKHKAKEGFEKTGAPVIVEDTCLIISSLNGLPGPLIKWFLKTIGNNGLIKITDTKNRLATAIVYIAVYNGAEYLIGQGKIDGTISKEERGNNGFGWDNIFIPNGSDKTFAEMTQEEKNRFSMRALALLNFKNKQVEK